MLPSTVKVLFGVVIGEAILDYLSNARRYACVLQEVNAMGSFSRRPQNNIHQMPNANLLISESAIPVPPNRIYDSFGRRYANHAPLYACCDAQRPCDFIQIAA